MLNRDQFYDFVDGQYDLIYYPLLDVSTDVENLATYYSEKQGNPFLKNEQYDIALATFKKINENLSKSIQFASLINLNAEILNK